VKAVVVVLLGQSPWVVEYIQECATSPVGNGELIGKAKVSSTGWWRSCARNAEGSDQSVSGTVRGWTYRYSNSGNAPSMAAMGLVNGIRCIRRRMGTHETTVVECEENSFLVVHSE